MSTLSIQPGRLTLDVYRSDDTNTLTRNGTLLAGDIGVPRTHEQRFPDAARIGLTTDDPIERQRQALQANPEAAQQIWSLWRNEQVANAQAAQAGRPLPLSIMVTGAQLKLSDGSTFEFKGLRDLLKEYGPRVKFGTESAGANNPNYRLLRAIQNSYANLPTDRTDTNTVLLRRSLDLASYALMSGQPTQLQPLLDPKDPSKVTLYDPTRRVRAALQGVESVPGLNPDAFIRNEIPSSGLMRREDFERRYGRLDTGKYLFQPQFQPTASPQAIRADQIAQIEAAFARRDPAVLAQLAQASAALDSRMQTVDFSAPNASPPLNDAATEFLDVKGIRVEAAPDGSRLTAYGVRPRAEREKEMQRIDFFNRQAEENYGDFGMRVQREQYHERKVELFTVDARKR